MLQASNSPVRLPPQFVEGERALIGGLLIDNDALPKVMAVLSPDDFYREPHRHIFSAILRLSEKNEPVDWVTLTAALKQAGTLEVAGGPAYLTELVDAVPTAAHALHYAKLIREKAVLRRLINASNEIARQCYEDHASIDEWIDEAERLIFQVGNERIQSGFIDAESLMMDAMKTIDAVYQGRIGVTGVSSGFADLDSLTAGFQKSDLVIIAGRPSMGKTSFALNIAQHAAIEENIPTAVFSLEMSKESIALRILCARARVNLKSIRNGLLREDDWRKLIGASGPISTAPFFVDDTPQISTLEMRAKARRLKKEHGLGLIIVDYLQLMKSSSRSDSREQAISEISRSLKALAKELSVPVIALSQLNRRVEERPNKRPQMADLRESGAIEQDADLIIFIYRDEVYNKSEDNPKKGEAEIILGKHRNGPIGTALVRFDAQFSTFTQYTSREDYPPEISKYSSGV